MTRIHKLSWVDRAIYIATNAARTKIGIVSFMFFITIALYKDTNTENIAKQMNSVRITGINIPKTISAPKLYTSAQKRLRNYKSKRSYHVHSQMFLHEIYLPEFAKSMPYCTQKASSLSVVSKFL